MSEHKKKNTKEEIKEEVEKTEEPEAENVDSADSAAKGMETLFERVLSLSQEVEILRTVSQKEKGRADDLKAFSERLQSDFDNYRKRTNENIKKIKDDAAAETIEKFLPALDSLSQGIVSVKDEQAVLGLKLIYRQFKETLNSLNVEEIDALDQAFDPNLHNAVMQESAKTKEEEGTISQVFTPGYKMGDRVIRHSVVKVRN